MRSGPLLKKIPRAYLRILKGGSSPTPTAEDAPTTTPLASLDILLSENNDVSGSVTEDEEEEEEFFFDADDELPNPDLEVTAPSIIFDVDVGSTRSNDEHPGLAVLTSSSSQPDDVTRVSSARRVSITQFSVLFAIHSSIKTCYQI